MVSFGLVGFWVCVLGGLGLVWFGLVLVWVVCCCLLFGVGCFLGFVVVLDFAGLVVWCDLVGVGWVYGDNNDIF